MNIYSPKCISACCDAVGWFILMFCVFPLKLKALWIKFYMFLTCLAICLVLMIVWDGGELVSRTLNEPVILIKVQLQSSNLWFVHF